MRSMLAPMIAMSRAAMSSMRSTAGASQVGLSHSTQVRKPASMASESKGRLAGFMDFLSFESRPLKFLYENDLRGICKEPQKQVEACCQIAIDAPRAWCKSKNSENL